MKTLSMPVTFYHLTNTIMSLYLFCALTWDKTWWQITAFLIHAESGDIFYNDFNTKENFGNFLLAQQDESKQVTSKRISYHNSFEKYTRNYLPSFSLEEVDRFDMLSNKNSKYLLYKFNDWIESLNAEKFW